MLGGSSVLEWSLVLINPPSAKPSKLLSVTPWRQCELEPTVQKRNMTKIKIYDTADTFSNEQTVPRVSIFSNAKTKSRIFPCLITTRSSSRWTKSFSPQQLFKFRKRNELNDSGLTKNALLAQLKKTFNSISDETFEFTFQSGRRLLLNHFLQKNLFYGNSTTISSGYTKTNNQTGE